MSDRPGEDFNQSPPYEDVDLFGSDQPLRDALAPNGAALAGFGRHWGSADMMEQGRLANENPPRLNTHDANGRSTLRPPPSRQARPRRFAKPSRRAGWRSCTRPMGRGRHACRHD
jgi:hypothetical protein